MLQQGIEVRKYLSARAGMQYCSQLLQGILSGLQMLYHSGASGAFLPILIILFPLTGILNIVKQHFIFKNVFLTYIIQ